MPLRITLMTEHILRESGTECQLQAQGSKPKAQGPKPNAQGSKPKAQSPKPKAQGPRPKAQGPRPKAQSPKPKAQSPKPKAQGPKPKAQSPKPKAQGPRPKAQSPRPKAQCPMPNAQCPKPKAQSPKPKAQSPKNAQHLTPNTKHPIRYHLSSRAPLRRGKAMAKICQVSGKKANNAKHIRHRHSGQWKFRAPKKNRLQRPNLQVVRLKTEHGIVRLQISTSVLKSPAFAAVVSGIRPIPKAWLKKPGYGI